MDGVQEFFVRTELGAQAAHVGVDGAAVARVAVAPDIAEQGFAVEHLAAAFHERNHEPEFEGGEIQFAASEPHLEAAAVKFEGTHAEFLAGFARAGLLDEQLQAQNEFARAERLGQVVIGAQFQASHALLGTRFGGEHDNGNLRGRFRRADLPADIFAPHLGDHQIEHDGGGKFFPRHPQPGHAIARLEHVVALSAKVQAEQVEDVGFVLDDQNGILVG